MAEPVPGLHTHMLVRDSEGKGSEANLATLILGDGFKGESEQAVVLSYGADISGAMRCVRLALVLQGLEKGIADHN